MYGPSHTRFYCIPGHCYIGGNELAARSAFEFDIRQDVNIPTATADLKTFVKN